MINLWYEESYWAHTRGVVSGPEKVVRNLIKSLDLMNIPYAINENKYKANHFIQYDRLAQVKHHTVDWRTAFIGPQLWPFETYGRWVTENPERWNQLICPSDWVKGFFKKRYFLPDNQLVVWPVGIDEFNNKRDIQYDCLIYFKRRSPEELEAAIKLLKKKKMTYKVLQYGKYTEEEFWNLANQAKFCFLINGTESQGIAVQEIMSHGVPLFVWDLDQWLDMGEENICPATSVPYWDERCGEKFYKKTMMSRTFTKFCAKMDEGGYDPKQYVKENLSLQRSAEILLDIVKTVQ